MKISTGNNLCTNASVRCDGQTNKSHNYQHAGFFSRVNASKNENSKINSSN